MSNFAVALMRCDAYDTHAVDRAISEGIALLPDVRQPRGRVVIKPNIVMAHPKIATEGYTRPQVIEGIIRWIQDRGEDVTSLDIVEKSGLGITTAGAFRWAGYRPLIKRHGVRLCAMEERPRSNVVLEKGKVHTHINIAREMAERDYLIFAPKLKTNVLSHAYTGAIKLNIGSVDSRERIAYHDHRLHIKMVDILEACNPDLIITDGVRLSFGGNQMTQRGVPFGVLALSTNALAHDMVCSRLLGLDPMKIDHIREAVDRGYGPDQPGDVQILGDYPLEKGRQIAAGLDFGFQPVEKLRCPMKITSGVPYCTGGCQGIFLDWLHMINDRKPALFKRLPKISVLIGKVEQTVEDRTVLLVGDCAAASKNVRARRTLRIKGCPPTHKRIVWDMMVKLALLAPLVRPSLIIDGFVLYPLKRMKGWWVNK